MSHAFDAFVLPRGVELPGPRAPSTTVPTTQWPLRSPHWDADWVAGLADTLAARRTELAARRATDVLNSLAHAGERFGDPRDPIHAEALELLPSTSGLSREMAEAVLDGMAAGWRRKALRRLVEAEFGCVEALDGFVETRDGVVDGRHGLADARDAAAAERRPTGQLTMPAGPRLCVQIVSGSVPGVGVGALIRSLLVKGPTLLKAGRGDVALPVLFGRALAEVDPELADALAVLYWPGGSERLEEAAIGRADVVVAYGSDETVRAVRDRTPVTSRFVAYHHRASVGVVGREALVADRMDRTAAEVARAVALFDQRGCVSPQVIYVEVGGEDAAEGSAAGRSASRGGRSAAQLFAHRLARAFEELEARLPGGTLDVEEASAVQQLRGTAELMAASGSPVEVVHGGDSSWTVVYEAEAGPSPSCVGRVVRIRPLGGLDELPALLEPARHHLQTVGIAGLGARAPMLATALGRLGVSRVAPFTSVAFPPADWHHDGGRPLGDLVRWVDLEPEGDFRRDAELGPDAELRRDAELGPDADRGLGAGE